MIKYEIESKELLLEHITFQAIKYPKINILCILPKYEILRNINTSIINHFSIFPSIIDKHLETDIILKNDSRIKLATKESIPEKIIGFRFNIFIDCMCYIGLKEFQYILPGLVKYDNKPPEYIKCLDWIDA